MSQTIPTETQHEVLVTPDDEHNRTLVEQVHPPGWENPTPDGRYNLVVIGAGTAGLVTAAGAAGLGAKVALVERHLMGGDCLNVGCVPSKALIAAARRAHAVRTAGEFGVRVEGSAVDFPAVMERMRRLRADISRHDSARRFSDLGVDVYIGEGGFEDSNHVRVGDRRLPFARAVIATGGRPAAPPIPGLEEAGYLTNETVFSLTELPARLAVIGGGPIGCELAQCFARFGAEVSLFERADQILTKEDRDAADVVRAAMERDGVELLTGSELVRVQRHGDTRSIAFEREGTSHELEVDAILVGVGRAPNVEGMGLEGIGVAYDERHGVQVDDHLRTTNPTVYAAGDVCFPYKFTHTADFLARIVIQNTLFAVGPFGRAKASALTIPWCTYTDPEIAHVGLYEAQARERGYDVQTLVQPMSGVDRAILDGETEGFVKVHLKAGSDRILGATVVAGHAGDLVSELSVAMQAKAGLRTVGSTIHPYPTQAEAVRKLGDQFNKGRLTPFLRRVFRWWTARRR